MVKREIKDFLMEYGGETYECQAPASLSSVLSKRGKQISEEAAFVDFTTELDVSDAALALKYVFLRIKGVEAPAVLLLNGEQIATLGGEKSCYSIDVRDRLNVGNNTLTVRFSNDNISPSRVGIFEPFEMVRFNNAAIREVAVSQKHEGGSVSVGVSVLLDGSPENVRAVATLVSSAGQIYYAGLTGGRGNIVVNDPLYWWPHGYGIQNLYKLTVNLYGESEIDDTVEFKIGLRTIVTASNADGSLFEVNGAKIMPMGAVYDSFDDPSSPSFVKKLEAYVTSAAIANYNTFVIPKDARRPSEKFFELCDLHGIMVAEEIGNVSDEALARIKSQSHHPSFAFLDIIGVEDGLEELLDRIDREVPNIEFCEYPTREEYPAHPSLPSEKTLLPIIPEDERHLFSKSVEALAKKDYISKMLLSVAERYPYPRSLSDFGYASKLASADIISKEISSARIARGAEGRAVFSSIGDSEESISSSAIDSQARWKALQYSAQKFFAPIAVFASEKGGAVTFNISNERKLDFEGSLEYRIADSKNITVYKNSEAASVDALVSKKLFVRDLSEYVSGHEDEYFLEYVLKEGTTVLYRDTLLFVPEKHFKFENPYITAEIAGSDRRFSMTLTARSFARRVELDFDGTDAVFSDNYFDITSGAPIKITFNVIGKIEASYHLSEVLKIRSIYDLMPKKDN